MAESSACPDLHELQQFLIGQAPEKAARQLEAHLARCPSCLSVLEELREEDPFMHAVRAGAVGRDVEEPDADLIARLRRLAPPTPPLPDVKERGISDLLEPPQAPDEIGRLGEYRVLKVLGVGGMGVVCLAQHARLKRLTAVKLLRPGAFEGPERLLRFRREAQLVAQLGHPHIISLFEAGEQNGRPFLAMEYAAGGSLAVKLADSVLAPRATAELVHLLAGAVQAAHSQGVLHRDLKPANVLLTYPSPPTPLPEAERGEKTATPPLRFGEGAGGRGERCIPKISDFGLAKQLDAVASPSNYETQSGAVLGTPAYMAPEQARGRNQELGPPADVYALGAILYECLTGRPPFKGATVLETLELVHAAEPVPPRRLQPGLPAELETICLKCLEKVPTKRYATAADLADDLHRFLEGKPIRARAASIGERLWKWARRRPAVAALLAVSALALVGAVLGIGAHTARLRREVIRAEKGEAEANKQRQRADAGYRKARNALKQILGRLRHSRLEEVPRLKELQQQQLEDALAFFQGALADLEESEPALREDVAAAYEEAALAERALGQKANAEKNFRKAAALWRELAEESPAESRFRARLASSFLGIAGCLPNAAAEPYCREAMSLFEVVVREEPANADYQSALAQTHSSLGVALNGQGKSECLAHYQRAADVLVRLAQEHPRENEYVLGAVEALNNVGVSNSFQGKPNQAAAAFRKAESLLQVAAANQAGKLALAVAAATVYQSWGTLYRLTGKTQEALDRLGRAQRQVEVALRQEPQHDFARQLQRNILGARATALGGAERFGEAAIEWARLAELSEGWARAYAYMGQAVSLSLAGEHEGAAAAAEAIAAQAQATGASLFTGARVLAIASTAAERDARLSPEKQASRSEQLAVRAAALLARAEAKGCFKDRGTAIILETDAELASLRNRPEVQRLLDRIKGKK